MQFPAYYNKNTAMDTQYENMLLAVFSYCFSYQNILQVPLHYLNKYMASPDHLHLPRLAEAQAYRPAFHA